QTPAILPSWDVTVRPSRSIFVYRCDIQGILLSAVSHPHPAPPPTPPPCRLCQCSHLATTRRCSCSSSDFSHHRWARQTSNSTQDSSGQRPGSAGGRYSSHGASLLPSSSRLLSQQFGASCSESGQPVQRR